MDFSYVNANTNRKFYTKITFDTKSKTVNYNFIVYSILEFFAPGYYKFDMLDQANKIPTTLPNHISDNHLLRYLPVWSVEENNRIMYKGVRNRELKSVFLDTKHHMLHDIDAYTQFRWPLIIVNSSQDTDIKLEATADSFGHNDII